MSETPEGIPTEEAEFFTQGSLRDGTLFATLVARFELEKWLEEELSISEKERMEIQFGLRPISKSNLKSFLDKVDEVDDDAVMDSSYGTLHSLVEGKIPAKPLWGAESTRRMDVGRREMLINRIRHLCERGGIPKNFIATQMSGDRTRSTESLPLGSAEGRRRVSEVLAKELGIPVEMIETFEVIPLSEFDVYFPPKQEKE